MTRPFIVGLRGIAGAGKTTLQRLICAQASTRRVTSGPASAPHIYPYSMAKPIRDGLACMGITKQNNLPLYRKAAQLLGTDLCREFDFDWWVKIAQENFKQIELDVILIDDIRFANETALCDFVIFVQPGFPILELDHESELYNRNRLGQIDFIALNNLGTQQQLATDILDKIIDLLAIHRRDQSSQGG